MLHFIVNKNSRTGEGSRVWKKIRSVLEENDVAYQAHVTEYEKHAAVIARDLCRQADEPVDLVVLGGDGSINEVINGVEDLSRLRLGVIPAGSGNDFAGGFHLSLDPIRQTRRIIRAVKTQDYEQMDLGRVRWVDEKGRLRKRLFAISSGIGLDALVCKKAETSRLKKVLNRFGLGSLTYILLTVVCLFRMETVRAVMWVPGRRRHRMARGIFAAAMNLPAEGGGVPMAPGASCRDGKLSICSAYGIPKWQTFFLLPLLAAAKHEGIKGFRLVNTRICRLKLSRRMPLHTDGEYCGMADRVQFSCLPGVLTLIRQDAP